MLTFVVITFLLDFESPPFRKTYSKVCQSTNSKRLENHGFEALHLSYKFLSADPKRQKVEMTINRAKGL